MAQVPEIPQELRNYIQRIQEIILGRIEFIKVWRGKAIVIIIYLYAQ